MKHIYGYVFVVFGFVALAVAGIYCLEYRHRQELEKVQNANIILISKQEMKLRLIDYKGEEIFSAPVATGKKAGNKRKAGDMRTPEGVFQVSDIQRATDWKHDFGDGKGEIDGAYGDFSFVCRYQGIEVLVFMERIFLKVSVRGHPKDVSVWIMKI